MREKGITIGVFSAKGGVGKTLSTLNLAGVYATFKKKVLIIDFDLFGGGIGVSLNKPSIKNIYNFAYDYNNNQYKDFKNYVTNYNEYIDFLASPKDPRLANKIDAKYIEIILDKAVFNYDIVLIDTNHILTENNILTMDLVDKLLLIVTNDPLDVKNMRNLVAILQDANFKNYKVLLNESINPFKKYFSLYDIKNIIGSNIDYVLSKDFFIKNIDSIIMKGKIITLDERVGITFSKDYTTFASLATDLCSKELKVKE